MRLTAGKGLALVTKHSGFVEEREWCVVYNPDRDTSGALKPFLNHETDGNVTMRLNHLARRRTFVTQSHRGSGQQTGSPATPLGTIPTYASLQPTGSYKREAKQMARDEHNKAAEHHENAAKAHRSAAEHHGKGDHAKGKEHAQSAKQHSQTANQHSDQAHSKSQQQK